MAIRPRGLAWTPCATQVRGFVGKLLRVAAFRDGTRRLGLAFA